MMSYHYLADGTVTVKGTCPVCKAEWGINVPRDGLRAWERGMKIQDALPGVPANQRELLKTGTCQICWDKMMGVTPGKDPHDGRKI